jgi:hypothetical protein
MGTVAATAGELEVEEGEEDEGVIGVPAPLPAVVGGEHVNLKRMT